MEVEAEMAERRILKIPCLLPDGAATDASIICLKAVRRRVRIGEEKDAALAGTIVKGSAQKRK